MTFSKVISDRMLVNTLNLYLQTQDLVNKAIALAIEEDLGANQVDLTTDAMISPSSQMKARILCKEIPVFVCGLAYLEQIYKQFDPHIECLSHLEEGALISTKPCAIATITGPAQAILHGERIVLNLLQRMSGIATITRKYTTLAQPHNIAILDTRKTMPGLRAFDRHAVQVGGGVNHRFGLNQGILIKDNHIGLAGSITQAIEAVRQSLPRYMIAVECSNLTEVKEALLLKAERILLDNMSPNLILQAISLVNRQAFIEVSGGINLDNLQDYLLPGVNAISIGALTHSPKTVDLSLEVESLL